MAIRTSGAKSRAIDPADFSDAPDATAAMAAIRLPTSVSISGRKASQTSEPGNHDLLHVAANVPPIASLRSMSLPEAPGTMSA